MDYLSNLSHHLFKLRLLSEGACYLFDMETQDLFKLAVEHQAVEVSIAFDAVGTALADMRRLIRQMQMELREEALRDRSEGGT